MTKRSGWYYEKRELRHTPSIQAGLTMDQETQYRREGARFILQVGNKMGLRYETMATGVVYFHRFYMVHTFQTFPRHVTACCCLFLAGKVEETPKKCRDIMKTARSLIDDTTWAEFGADPREEVMTLERILLQTIKFDFIVEHPYTYLLKYAKCLKGDKKRLPNMVQMAWTFVNDSLCTTLCLQWEPEIIAIALMYLAGKLSKFDVTDWVGRTPKHQRWWDMYVEGISMELLEDICHQVLDLYSPNRSEAGGASSEPSITMPTAAPRRPVTPTQSSSTAPPPAKKAKKEEVKSSPVKTESTPQPQAYQYPYAYQNYPQAAYSSQTSTQATPTTPTPRYQYPYPPSTTQGPPPQAPPPQAPPPTYPNQQRHYPPPAVTTPQAPPPHYATQPPPTHYSSASHPTSTYHQAGAAGHYAAPPTNQPPPSHYAPPPHGSTSSSYYPPPPSTNNPPPNYPPAGPSSNYPPPSSYPHSSSRPYYPPSS
ncbi:cyclin-K-like isoform X1 [Penaeus chinensis]|uniref:cyclin-K-like isoform X1 n=2 Tax=Penaeus chinensis TaxID=139456 RepID=UPI001FB78022|nr:cyclin-K-like isoform X1 [Penaeus chinensis]